MLRSITILLLLLSTISKKSRKLDERFGARIIAKMKTCKMVHFAIDSFVLKRWENIRFNFQKTASIIKARVYVL